MKLKKILPCLAFCLVFSVSGCYRGEYPYHAWDGTVCADYWGQDPDDPESIMVPNYRNWAEVESGDWGYVDYVIDLTITDIADINSIQTAMDDEYAAYDTESGETKERYYYFTPYHFYINDIVYKSEDVIDIESTSFINEMLQYNDEPYYTDSDGVEHLQYFLFLWGLSCSEPGYCYSNTEKAFVGASYRMILKCRYQVEYYSDYGETSLYPYHIFFTSSHGNSIRLLANDSYDDDQINRWLDDEEYDIFRDIEEKEE